MDDVIWLMEGDCLERMKEIPDKSIDMVLCDLPYGITDHNWDEIIDGEQLFGEYKRLCKQNANVLLFCNISFAKYLMNAALDSEFSHCLIWLKNNVTRGLSFKSLPMSRYEMILCFRVNKYANKKSHFGLRNYFMNELGKSNFTIKQIESMIPNYSAHHWFRWSSDYRIPTKENYIRLREITGFFNRPYSEIKAEFNSEKDNAPTYHPGIIKDDVIYGELTERRVHVTQKPVSLLQKLINAYSNVNDIILDNCMGSGSTGVACRNTGRRFIGIEKDHEYFKIAQKRIDNARETSIVGLSPEIKSSSQAQMNIFDFMPREEE